MIDFFRHSSGKGGGFRCCFQREHFARAKRKESERELRPDSVCVGWPFSLVNQRTFHRVCKGLNSFYADYTARLKPVQADYFESACWFQFVFVIDHACSPLLKRMVSCPPGITVISSTILRTRSSSYSFNSIAVCSIVSIIVCS